MTLIESKRYYKKRFFGYHTLGAILKIVDGMISLLVSPLGYTSGLYLDWCEWNLRKDMERIRKRREA